MNNNNNKLNYNCMVILNKYKKNKVSKILFF